MTDLLLLAVYLFALGGLVAFPLHRLSPRWSSIVVVIAAVCGGAVGLPAALAVTVLGSASPTVFPWSLPGGSFSFGVDPLSAVFLIPLFILVPAASLFSHASLKLQWKRRDQGFRALNFGFMAAAMVLVLIARNALLFLLAWEVMALASFFLTIADHEEERVRRAGWLYLTVSHLGAAALLCFFLLLSQAGGSFEFGTLQTADIPGPLRTVLFLLAIAGFGTKAGFVPFHIWLPEADAAAPSPVAALKSAVLVTMGIYGILRSLSFLAPFPAWWGGLLIALGLFSALYGVLCSLAQRDLRKALAYSTVENIGIILTGIGLGVLGTALHSIPVAIAGFTAALVHVLSHAFFKSLLFLSAGAVGQAAGTFDIEKLGGFGRRMPRLAHVFRAASMAACALPPFCGFVGEFLLLSGALAAAMASTMSGLAIAGLCILGVVALVSGLSVATFSRLSGMVFSGNCRSDIPHTAHDAGPAMRIALGIPLLLIVALSCAAPLMLKIVGGGVMIVCPADPLAMPHVFNDMKTPLAGLAIVSAALLCMVVLLRVFRNRLLLRRSVRSGLTWDCGYACPSARMQYTGASFAQPLLDFFAHNQIIRRTLHMSRGMHPLGAALHTHIDEPFMRIFYVPMAQHFLTFLSGLRVFSGSRIQTGVLYVVLTALLLLFWNYGLKP